MSGLAYRTPYASSPGGSLPDPSTDPREGAHELWAFFWLSLANTAIIGVTGLVVWWLIHR
ncbi:MAG: hypothetical protein L3K13_03765 [Thermoplasmata archaeon]|nr:hypothetical protein [Thermoplasmata archaeon]